MKHAPITATWIVALLALTACGSDTGPAEDTEPAESAEASAEETEQPAEQAEPDVEELIAQENALFDEWFEAEADSAEEAEAEAELDDIYDQLDEIYGDIAQIEELPPELLQLALVQFAQDRGLTLQELEDGAEPEDPILGDREFTGITTETVEAELGDEVDVDQGPFTEYGDYVGTLTLESIERPYRNAECDEWDETPENGEFVALQITLDADEEADDVFSVSESDFYIIDENDTMLRAEITSYNGWACADTAGALQSAQPGTNTSGLVILDTDVTEGTLVYAGGVHEIRWDLNQ